MGDLLSGTMRTTSRRCGVALFPPSSTIPYASFLLRQPGCQVADLTRSFAPPPHDGFAFIGKGNPDQEDVLMSVPNVPVAKPYPVLDPFPGTVGMAPQTGLYCEAVRFSTT